MGRELPGEKKDCILEGGPNVEDKLRMAYHMNGVARVGGISVLEIGEVTGERRISWSAVKRRDFSMG